MATVDSDDAEVTVMPFGQAALAEALCTEEWQIYTPVAIAIEEFMEDQGRYAQRRAKVITGIQILRARN